MHLVELNFLNFLFEVTIHCWKLNNPFLGFFDGSFIPLIKPKHSGESYFNRKKFYSVTLQAVCTGDQRIIDVSVGYPSSMNDKRIFNVARLEEVVLNVYYMEQIIIYLGMENIPRAFEWWFPLGEIMNCNRY